MEKILSIFKKFFIFLWNILETLDAPIQLAILITIGVLLTILILYLAVKIDELMPVKTNKKKKRNYKYYR